LGVRGLSASPVGNIPTEAVLPPVILVWGRVRGEDVGPEGGLRGPGCSGGGGRWGLRDWRGVGGGQIGVSDEEICFRLIEVVNFFHKLGFQVEEFGLAFLVVVGRLGGVGFEDQVEGSEGLDNFESFSGDCLHLISILLD